MENKEDNTVIMPLNEGKIRIETLLNEACDIIKATKDDDIPEILGEGIINKFVESIAEKKSKKDQSIYDYLLENKYRLQLLSLLRLAINNNYSIEGIIQESGENVFVSPFHIQWFENGVLFLQGDTRFAGLIGLYQDGEIKFGIAKRDIKKGDNFGPDDIVFVSIEECRKQKKEMIPQKSEDLDLAHKELDTLLKKKINKEAEYQKYLAKYPWVIGLQYLKINSHISFNEKNIPDFTAVRVRDSARDIIEIKPPFLEIFKEDETFRAEFNNAWNQAERYLDFTRRESDYLYRQKGMIFDNPACILVTGYKLNENQKKVIRLKERMNPAITILTYDDLLVFVKNTIKFVKDLK